jgi:hypothetical protein
MIYAARFEAMNGLVAFLTENCCQGSLAGTCAPVASSASPRESAMKRFHVHVAVDDLNAVHRLLFGAVRCGACRHQDRLRQVDA